MPEASKRESQPASAVNAANAAKPGVEAKAYRPPSGVSKRIEWRDGKVAWGVRAEAQWLLVREHGVPTAEVFCVSYQLEAAKSGRGSARGGASGSGGQRPVTFLFNGGPGAASAFLHLGTAGPWRVAFGATGSILPPPAMVEDNPESWLAFTDLVFIDPVGTGLSRTVAFSRLEQQGVDAEPEKLAKASKDAPEAGKSFFKVKRDIDVLCEVVGQWLSEHNRWGSAVSIAGESYGGFRVGKLVRALPERGIGVSGAVMVSPAIDFLTLIGGDYEPMSWVNTLPTMARAAGFHKRAGGKYKSMSAEAIGRAAEDFGELRLAPLLMRGERTPTAERARVLDELAEMTGLPRTLVERHNGRVGIDVFGRELLRDRGLLCGLYDASVTGHDVFPDREGSPSPDPTLAGIMSAFNGGINAVLRGELGLKTDREYLLLADEAWKHWADDRMSGYWHRQLDCADDLRYGLAMNPALKLLITHGHFDLVTTYFSSAQSVSLMRLPAALRAQVALKNYDGGHMFYTWAASRKALASDVRPVVGG